MSDMDRADRFVSRWWRDGEPDGRSAEERSALAAAFATVRQEERRAIVAYLLERCASLAWTLSPKQVAERLERGDHLEVSP